MRERILVATLEVIATDGLDAVRHRRVADLAGVSLGSTTYHFSSRDELVDEAFAHYLDEATAVLRELAAPDDDVDEPSQALVRYLVDLLGRERRAPHLLRAEYELILHATRSEALAERLSAWEELHAAHFEAFLRTTGAADPAEGARALVAIVRGLELELLIHPRRRVDLDRRLAPLVRALWPAASS